MHKYVAKLLFFHRLAEPAGDAEHDADAGYGLYEPVFVLFADEATSDAGELTMYDDDFLTDGGIVRLVLHGEGGIEVRIAQQAELEHVPIRDFVGSIRISAFHEVCRHGTLAQHPNQFSGWGGFLDEDVVVHDGDEDAFRLFTICGGTLAIGHRNEVLDAFFFQKGTDIGFASPKRSDD